MFDAMLIFRIQNAFFGSTTLTQASSNLKLQQVILPSVRHLGGGFEVRRALPSPQRQMVGPFIFLDSFGPTVFHGHENIDVRPHPHIGLATVTYLIEGSVIHRDSEGYVQPIEPGEVNMMTAGRGIVHSERAVKVQEGLILLKNSEI